MATCALLTTRSSWPSGAAFFTASIAINPLAPGFASTITGCDHAFDSLSAMMRVKIAGPAPAAYGAVILTTFDGKVWARAIDPNPSHAAIKKMKRRRAVQFMGSRMFTSVDKAPR